MLYILFNFLSLVPYVLHATPNIPDFPSSLPCLVPLRCTNMMSDYPQPKPAEECISLRLHSVIRHDACAFMCAYFCNEVGATLTYCLIVVHFLLTIWKYLNAIIELWPLIHSLYSVYTHPTCGEIIPTYVPLHTGVDTEFCVLIYPADIC